MKRILTIFFVLLFGTSLLAQNEDTIKVLPSTTRNSTLEKAFVNDSVNKSPLLQSLEGIGIKAVKEAYKINRQEVDSVLAADSLQPTFFRVLAYKTVGVFKQASKNQRMAMAIFLPIFLVILLIIVLIYAVKVFVIRPELSQPIKPENDPNKNGANNNKQEEEQSDEDEEIDDDDDGEEEIDDVEQ